MRAHLGEVRLRGTSRVCIPLLLQQPLPCDLRATLPQHLISATPPDDWPQSSAQSRRAAPTCPQGDAEFQLHKDLEPGALQSQVQ